MASHWHRRHLLWPPAPQRNDPLQEDCCSGQRHQANRDKPADAYKTVAETLLAHLPEQYHEWMNRKVTKRKKMCTPYGVTYTALANYIRRGAV